MASDRAKVGDRYVLEALEQHQWLLGGEGSGHLLMRDKHTTGDGLISALAILEACLTHQKTLVDWLADVPLMPQSLLATPLKNPNWATQSAYLTALAHAQQTLGHEGRILVRASGTEPKIRVMVEAPDATLAQSLAMQLVDALV